MAQLLTMSAFRDLHVAADANGKKPTTRTMRKWRGAVFEGGRWYMDLDARQVGTATTSAMEALRQEIDADPVMREALR